MLLQMIGAPGTAGTPLSSNPLTAFNLRDGSEPRRIALPSRIAESDFIATTSANRRDGSDLVKPALSHFSLLSVGLPVSDRATSHVCSGKSD